MQSCASSFVSFQDFKSILLQLFSHDYRKKYCKQKLKLSKQFSFSENFNAQLWLDINFICNILTHRNFVIDAKKNQVKSMKYQMYV